MRIQQLDYQNESEIPSQFRCIICKSVPKSLMIDIQCSIIYCFKCSGKSTLFCRHQLVCSSQIEQMRLDQITIQCKGCLQKIAANKKQKHLFECSKFPANFQFYYEFKNQYFCKYCEEFKCKGCFQIKKISNLEKSLQLSEYAAQSQLYQIYLCQYCEKQYPYDEFQHHLMTCDLTIVSCELCQLQLRRDLFIQHYFKCLNDFVQIEKKQMILLNFGQQLQSLQSQSYKADYRFGSRQQTTKDELNKNFYYQARFKQKIPMISKMISDFLCHSICQTPLSCSYCRSLYCLQCSNHQFNDCVACSLDQKNYLLLKTLYKLDHHSNKLLDKIKYLCQDCNEHVLYKKYKNHYKICNQTERNILLNFGLLIFDSNHEQFVLFEDTCTECEKCVNLYNKKECDKCKIYLTNKVDYLTKEWEELFNQSIEINTNTEVIESQFKLKFVCNICNTYIKHSDIYNHVVNCRYQDRLDDVEKIKKQLRKKIKNLDKTKCYIIQNDIYLSQKIRESKITSQKYLQRLELINSEYKIVDQDQELDLGQEQLKIKLRFRIRFGLS